MTWFFSLKDSQSHEKKWAIVKTLENPWHISAHIWNSYENGLLLKKRRLKYKGQKLKMSI